MHRTRLSMPCRQTRRKACSWICQSCRRRHRIVALILLRLCDAIGDLIIIALVGDKDMPLELESGGAVDRACHDADIGPVRALPEQIRSAQPAEAAPRLGRGGEPGEVVGALDADMPMGRRGRRHVMSAGPPAL